MTSAHRILIVDDDRDFAESLGELFESLGYATALAFNREEARKVMVSYRPDLAIVDVRLGHEDGIDVIPMVRRSLPDTLCIVVTAFADMDTALRALRAGAYDFLHKPVRMPELTVLLRHSLARIELQREHRDAVERLRDNEERLRNLVEGSLQGIMVIAGDRPVFVNESLCRMFGYETEEGILALESAGGLFGPRDCERVMELVNRMPHDPSLIVAMEHFEGMHREGHAIWLETSLRHVRWGKLEAVQAVMVDVSERRRFEEERNRLAAAVQQSADSVFIADLDGRILYVNPAFEQITGYAAAEAVGGTPEHLKVTDKNLRDEFLERALLENPDQWRHHGWRERKDGTRYQCDSVTTAMRDADRQIMGFVEVRRDTTDQHRLQEQLRQAQKMEAIGVLAGGIAHDFNNLLTPIIGFTDLVRRGLSTEDAAHKDLTIVYDSAHRAKDLVEQILVFSRKRESRRNLLNLNEVVRNSIRLLRATLPKTVTLVEDIPDGTLAILGDSSLFQQALVNLCINAHQAMPDQGTITVSIAAVDLNKQHTSVGDTITGRFARLRVKDTGHGMDADTIQHVFEPFFTARRDRSGTGLGLAMVFGTVKNHDGFVDVQSEVGKGSQFDLYFPLPDGALEERVAGSRERTRRAVSGNILLVDDEPANGEVGRRVLESAGYTVTVETQPRVALETMMRDPARFDVLITDESMPEMPGHELIRRARESGWSGAIVVLSGYQAVITPERQRELGISGSLTKPYSKDALLTAVEAALHGTKPAPQAS